MELAAILDVILAAILSLLMTYLHRDILLAIMCALDNLSKEMDTKFITMMLLLISIIICYGTGGHLGRHLEKKHFPEVGFLKKFFWSLTIPNSRQNR